MNWMQAMADAIDYIEAHLTETIDIREVAKRASSSTFHYQRMFSFLTDMSVQEYIRNRRMTLAASELIATDTKVIDLAFKYGYESSEAFSRAFKSVHGYSPRSVRKGEAPIKAFLKLTIHLSLKGDVPMDYKLDKKDKFSFYGITRKFSTVDGANFREIPMFWGEVMEDGSYSKLMETCTEPLCLGVCMPMDPEKDVEFDYIIGLRGDEPVEGYDFHEVPEAEWAVFDVHGPINPNLQDAWKRIFSEWFPQTGFKHAMLPEFEVYHDGDVTSEDYLTEIWIPIER